MLDMFLKNRFGTVNDNTHCNINSETPTGQDEILKLLKRK